jgi:hypothetical protein
MLPRLCGNVNAGDGNTLMTRAGPRATRHAARPALCAPCSIDWNQRPSPAPCRAATRRAAAKGGRNSLLVLTLAGLIAIPIITTTAMLLQG